jgi:hypothetical protein
VTCDETLDFSLCAYVKIFVVFLVRRTDMLEEKKRCKVVPCSMENESFVFVSYAHSDSAGVFPIIENVSANGFSIWYDKGINISSTWTDEIATAIMNCKVFVVFITKESVASPYVRSEIEFALNNKIKIIPVYLDGMEVLPPGLALGLNATQGITDTKNPAQIAAQICEALDYNNVARSGDENYSAAGRGENNEANRSGYPKLFQAACVAAVLIAAIAIGWSSFGRGRSNGYSIVLDKASYTPAEPIFINVSGVPQEMLDAGAIAGVCGIGAPQGEFLSYEYITDGQARIMLRAPLETGRYEIRGYSSGNVLSKKTLAASVKFAVAGNSMGAFSIGLDKTRCAPGENITANVTGVPKNMIDDGAIVGVYRADAAPDKFITYVSIGERDSELVFSAPGDAGEYEVRGYANNDVLAESAVTARVPFKVADLTAVE